MDTNYYGLIGYICLFVFNLFKIFNTNQSIYELIGIILLLIPVGLISFYYTRVIQSSLNEMNNKKQLATRLLYHLTFIIFIMYSIFILNSYYYYLFGLIAHTILLYNVITKSDYLIGTSFLLIFFVFGSFFSFKNLRSLWFQFIAQVILIIFFSKTIINKLKDKKLNYIKSI